VGVWFFIRDRAVVPGVSRRAGFSLWRTKAEERAPKRLGYLAPPYAWSMGTRRDHTLHDPPPRRPLRPRRGTSQRQRRIGDGRAPIPDRGPQRTTDRCRLATSFRYAGCFVFCLNDLVGHCGAEMVLEDCPPTPPRRGVDGGRVQRGEMFMEGPRMLRL